jgi:hypothetical protein
VIVLAQGDCYHSGVLGAVLEWAVVFLPTILSVIGVLVSIKAPSSKYHATWRICLVITGITISGVTLWQQSRSKASHAAEINGLNGKINNLNSTVSAVQQQQRSAYQMQQSEAARRQQAEKDLAVIVQTAGRSTREGVVSDINRSLSVQLSGTQILKSSPAVVGSLFVEVRVTCSLRNPSNLPPDLAFAVLSNESGSYLESPQGKAHLRPITRVSYKRTEEEGKAIATLGYDLPPNSDLIGVPLSTMSRYTSVFVDLWGVSGNDFSSCNHLDLTLRLNGTDVYRRAQAFQHQMETGHTMAFRSGLSGMAIP